MKRLVVCCDGTWNTPRDNTNIHRTYRFLHERIGRPSEKTTKDGIRTCAGRAKDGSEVVLFYDQGVGTNWFEKIRGGALGVGLSENVRDAYHFLAHAYSPGAEIYVFGFSRGAYTARSLCGFIKAAGLLKAPSEKDVWRAYFDYYSTEERIVARPSGMSFSGARDRLRKRIGDLIGNWSGADLGSFPRHDGVKIRFIGVYDTVGALGVPLAATASINEPIVGFHDTSMSELIEHAVHALAVDEKRGPYSPTLWTLDEGQELARGQTILQVWFPGVHSDIGGGYSDKGIGDITLDFMMQQTAQHGLVLDPESPHPDVTFDLLPPQHESFDEKWRILSESLKMVPLGVRSVGTTVKDASGRNLTVAGEVRAHKSLVRRFGQQVTTILNEESGQTRNEIYRPPNVTASTLPEFE